MTVQIVDPGEQRQENKRAYESVMVCICSAQGVALLEGVSLLEKVCHCGCGL